MALCDSDERSGESHPPRWLRLEEAPCRSENGSRNISKTNPPLSIYNRTPNRTSPLNKKHFVSRSLLEGDRKSQAGGCKGRRVSERDNLLTQKEKEEPQTNRQSKKSPTNLRVPAPQPPEPMISIARKQRTISLRERAAFFCNFSFRLWRKKS